MFLFDKQTKTKYNPKIQNNGAIKTRAKNNPKNNQSTQLSSSKKRRDGKIEVYVIDV